VAQRGRARDRVEEIARNAGNPFQFIVNFQIPGDPPVSIVAFFAVPPYFEDSIKDAETRQFYTMFKKFIDLPRTEEARMKLWGLPKAPEEDSEVGAAAGGAGGKGGGWFKMPSDITWPDGTEPGSLPQEDFRNVRCKLVPLITEGTARYVEQ
jgi:Protein ENHANCED DISEASE RESISTANCE 2, C-terminal